jgi:hypothetical protein
MPVFASRAASSGSHADKQGKFTEMRDRKSVGNGVTGIMPIPGRVGVVIRVMLNWH